jgi:protein-tyrosine phosphatase
MGRTELHFHLLPAVDDGPPTMEGALALARAAVADGTSTVVATPHIRADQVSDPTVLPPVTQALRAALAEEGVPLAVRPGGELGHEHVPLLSDSQLETIALGPAGRRFVLLEVPFSAPGEDFVDAVRELGERGFGVLLAHPERTDAPLDELLPKLGPVPLQVNATSLLGDHGPRAQAVAERFVRARRVAALASDAHSTLRAPALGPGVKAAGRLGLPPAAAERLVAAGPARLLARGIDSARPPLPAAA